MTRNEKRLKAAEEAMAEKSGEIQAIWKKADDENRGTTDEERQEVETLLKAVDELKLEKHEAEAAITVEAEVRSIADGMGPSTSVVPAEAPKPPERAKSIGEQIVTSDGYKRMAEKGFAGRCPRARSSSRRRRRCSRETTPSSPAEPPATVRHSSRSTSGRASCRSCSSG